MANTQTNNPTKHFRIKKDKGNLVTILIHLIKNNQSNYWQAHGQDAHTLHQHALFAR